MSIEHDMYKWAKDLFPIHRSITGDGVRETLNYINNLLSCKLKIHEVPSGTKAFDWTVPKEWNMKDAWIKDESGRKIIDYANSNLHVVSYSIPIDKVITLEKLNDHLHSLPGKPTAIPYVTSYYKENWGFCISDEQRKKLKSGKYHVHIDSTLKEGSLTYGELIIKGNSKEEILLSTYVCHPSMANNELSGLVVMTALANWISSIPQRKHAYRILFIPETIGAIVYLSRNLKDMKKNTKAGFVITCAGDNRTYSLIRSRYGNTLSDKVTTNILNHWYKDYKEYSFLGRGSDERQYCFPGIDLPVVSLTRSKYREYPEYHTSLDDLNLISPEGLGGSYEVLKKCLEALEKNKFYKVNSLCEPQLGKRGLYPEFGTGNTHAIVRKMMDFMVYADGSNDLIDISNIIGIPVWDLYPVVESFVKSGLLTENTKRIS